MKESNCFNDQTSNFCKEISKYIPVQTPRNNHQQRTYDLFKLINKDTAVIINTLF